MRAWPCVLALAGCDHVFGLGDPYEDAAAVSMGGSDATIDSPAVHDDGAMQPMPALLIRFPFDGDLMDSTRTVAAQATSGGYTLRTTGGKFGGEVTIDGTSCLMFTLDPMPSMFSIVLWAEETSQNTQYVPLLVRPHTAASVVQDWAFYGKDNGSQYLMSSTTGNQAFAIAPGLGTSWHQYVATFDGSFVRIYVDGTNQGPAAGRVPDYGTGTGIYLGCDGAGTNAKFAGSFDEVQVYDGALTDLEVTQLTVSPTL